MRRGHPNRGGWRSENPRPFRPRNAGSSPYWQTRSYPPVHHIGPRYPPPPHSSRYPYRGGHSYGVRPNQPEHAELNSFRPSHHEHRNSREDKRDYHRYSEHSDHNRYPDSRKDDRYKTNSMGDVDHRSYGSHHSNYPGPISPWSSGPMVRLMERSDDQMESGNKLPVHDYPGHRPPASDHYEVSTGPADNSNAFSRSVDDTVDIIRRKLQNRNDPQSQNETTEQDPSEGESAAVSSIHKHSQEEQIHRKKPLRPRQLSQKTNCNQIKNKIVHQLFKMDKDRIHKLMDNPNSSTKFEYAINSLITESQNSFNRQLRAAAEKTLHGTRNDVVNYNEEDTIYEDTFMRQMQCVLDPQDTVFLEDIKPIVMAELNKVLQLSELEQHQNYSVEESDYMKKPDSDQLRHGSYADYPGEPHDSQQFYIEQAARFDQALHYEVDNNVVEEARMNPDSYLDSSVLFERRPSRASFESNKNSANLRHRRMSLGIDAASSESMHATEIRPRTPLFAGSTEQLSDEEDQFAEFDKQYHVAVDHSLIDLDSSIHSHSPQPIFTPDIKREYHDSHHTTVKCEKPYETHSTSISKPTPSSEKTPNIPYTDYDKEEERIKLELLDEALRNSETFSKSPSKKAEKTLDDGKVKKEKIYDKKDKSSKSDSSSTSVSKSPADTNPRKRFNDQRPSHRKEKRKKSTSSNSYDGDKQVPSKNTSANVKDSATKTSTKPKSSEKSVISMYFKKEDKKLAVCNENNYPEKYVKRKESLQKAVKEKHSEHKNHNSSSHSDSNNKDSNLSSTPTKSSKLHTFDMFTEKPRKPALHSHQGHRNTANNPNKNEEKFKTIPAKIFGKQVVKKHISIQVSQKCATKECQTSESKSCTTRYCQTVSKKCVSTAMQTTPVPPSTDPFERMKEIDMEIQVLLQEKFKLYNSIESRESHTGSMQNMGLTVLNVTPLDSNEDELSKDNYETTSADVMIDELTNIPLGELEQIALESIDNEPAVDTTKAKKTGGQKVLQSKVTPTSKKNKKAKTPNISILEQIITDDRPIEEIISLDDLETSPVKTRNKNTRRGIVQRPKKSKKPIQKQLKTVKKVMELDEYYLKECSVVLVREDLSKYTCIDHDTTTDSDIEYQEDIEVLNKENVEIVSQDNDEVVKEEIIEETTINEYHFHDDMLGVSEDIVIGELCEVKLSETESNVPISEEIVLDNSQSKDDVQMSAEDSVEADSCKTYDYSADEDLKHDSITVTGNGDAVLAIECIDNNFLAAGLDGNVYYFSGEGHLIRTLRGSNLPVTCLTIVKEKYETIVYTGSLDSRIRYYDLETGLEKGLECNVLSPIQTMDRAWDTVFVGTRTGFVLQFECKNHMLIPVSSIKFSDHSILALRALKEGARKVLLVAPRSENVSVKDAQTGLLLRTLEGPKMTVYTLLFEDSKVYCGTSGSQIQVFDFHSGCHSQCHSGGKGAVCLRAAGGLVFAGCYDGCVYVYGRRSTPLAQLKGPNVMLLSLAVTPTKIIAGYKDRSLYIWKIPVNVLNEMVL